MTIGDRIKARRLELNLTLEDVGKLVGVTRQTVQKYESGVVLSIPSDKIELLAKALDTTPTCLMGWDDPPSNPQDIAHLLVDTFGVVDNDPDINNMKIKELLAVQQTSLKMYGGKCMDILKLSSLLDDSGKEIIIAKINELLPTHLNNPYCPYKPKE